MNPEDRGVANTATPHDDLPAEILLDKEVERIERIDQQVRDLLSERASCSESVHKLREFLSRKLDNAANVAETRNAPPVPSNRIS